MKSEKLRLWRDLVSRPLHADAQRWSDASLAESKPGWRRFTFLLRYGGFRATVLARVGYWAHVSGVRAIPTLLHEANQFLHGIELTPSIPIGPGLYMPHSVGSVVTARSIGSNVELQGGITIGLRKGDGFPTLEDGVVVSCGARVLGPIVIGAGAILGANAVVIADVEPGSVMVGVPARAMKLDGKQ